MREDLVQLEKRVDQRNSNLVMLYSLVLTWKDLLKVFDHKKCKWFPTYRSSQLPMVA